MALNKLYLTIDTLALNIGTPQHFTLQLGNYSFENYTKIALKHVHIQHDTDAYKLFYFNVSIAKPLYIHCSLLNKEENLINGEKSDVISILYPESKLQKFMSTKPASNSPKLMKYGNKIEMSLTNCDRVPIENKGKFSIIYEFEFS